MARFHGKVGYGWAEEKPIGSGIWENQILEFPYFGDVVRNTQKLEAGAGLIDNIVVNNNISIVADAYAIDNFYNIKYVEWAGEFWTVTNVEVQRPRLILTIGSVYNGPTACETP